MENFNAEYVLTNKETGKPTKKDVIDIFESKLSADTIYLICKDESRNVPLKPESEGYITIDQETFFHADMFYKIKAMIYKRPFYKSHYDYIDKHIEKFFDDIGLDSSYTIGLSSCHGDKCYCYKSTWHHAGIHFYHGAMIYLLSYSMNMDRTNVSQWVIDVYERYKEFLPDAE